MSMQSSNNLQPLDKILNTDVVVCGGGIAGTIAAVAAARSGARTVLIERYGFLGGNATAGAVGQFNSWQTSAGRRVVAGLADELVHRLRRYDGARDHEVFVMSTGHRMDRIEYAPELLKLVLDDMIAEAGVQPLLHTCLLSVAKDGRRVQSLDVLARGGSITIQPGVVIDASGDLELLKLAGASFLPLEPGESLQPATMMFRFGPIDFEQFDALSPEDVRKLAHEGVAQGRLARAALHFSRSPFSQDGWFNISRLAVDATDPFALSRAEIEGRRQGWNAANFLRDHVPGCESGRLMSYATQVGVRETRRAHGDYVLTGQDLRSPPGFADAIAAGAYPIDIHPAQGSELHYEPLPEDLSYQIPYRSLVPQSLDNVLVTGRGISATHEALAGVRVMTIAMAMGQAAGVAAAMTAMDAQPSVRAIDVCALRTSLIEAGACLG